MFDGCADGDAAVASGYEVDVGGAEDVGEGSRPRRRTVVIWPLAGAMRGWPGGRRPRAGDSAQAPAQLMKCLAAMAVVGVWTTMRALSASTEMTGESSMSADSGGDGCGGKRGAEVSWVEAGFVEEEEIFAC